MSSFEEGALASGTARSACAALGHVSYFRESMPEEKKCMSILFRRPQLKNIKELKDVKAFYNIFIRFFLTHVGNAKTGNIKYSNARVSVSHNLYNLKTKPTPPQRCSFPRNTLKMSSLILSIGSGSHEAQVRLAGALQTCRVA